MIIFLGVAGGFLVGYIVRGLIAQFYLARLKEAYGIVNLPTFKVKK
jgi:hypothetical protein